MYIEIGAYEAKTKLSGLLRDIKAGKRFTITHRGERIADLIPSEQREVVDIPRAVERMLEFMATQKQKTGLNLDALIDEGRA